MNSVTMLLDGMPVRQPSSLMTRTVLLFGVSCSSWIRQASTLSTTVLWVRKTPFEVLLCGFVMGGSDTTGLLRFLECPIDFVKYLKHLCRESPVSWEFRPVVTDGIADKAACVKATEDRCLGGTDRLPWNDWG